MLQNPFKIIKNKLHGTKFLVDIVGISDRDPVQWFRTCCSVQVDMCLFSAHDCIAVITWSREDRGSGKYNATRLQDAVCRGHKQFACFPLIQQSKLYLLFRRHAFLACMTLARSSDARISYASRPGSNPPTILRYNSPPPPTHTHTHTHTNFIILYWHTAFGCKAETVAESHVEAITRIQTYTCFFEPNIRH
jgi:hypothetical protein